MVPSVRRLIAIGTAAIKEFEQHFLGLGRNPLHSPLSLRRMRPAALSMCRVVRISLTVGLALVGAAKAVLAHIDEREPIIAVAAPRLA